MAKTIDERMQALSRAVMKDASQDAEKIKADALKQADTTRQEAHKKAEAEHKEIIDHALQQAANIKSQNIAAAKLKAQMLWIDRREKLLNKVFDAARERIESITHWNNYDEIVFQMVEEAVESLGATTARIHADKTTHALLASGMLEQITGKLKYDLQLGEQLDHGTGIIAETIEGHRQFDNTLEARLDRLQDALRSPVFHILMGEAL